MTLDDISAEDIIKFEAEKISDFKSICDKKILLFIEYDSAEDSYTDSEDDHNDRSNSQFDFVRDVLGGDPNASWNID